MPRSLNLEIDYNKKYSHYTHPKYQLGNFQREYPLSGDMSDLRGRKDNVRRILSW